MSVRLLAFVGRRIQTARVLLVVTARQRSWRIRRSYAGPWRILPGPGTSCRCTLLHCHSLTRPRLSVFWHARRHERLEDAWASSEGNAAGPAVASRSAAQPLAKPAHHNVVAHWNAIAQNAIVTVGAQPIQRSQLWITLVHAAIYDAVMSIDGEYEPFKVTTARLRPASHQAAAIAAAHGVLGRLLPGQQAALEAERETSLAAIRDGLRKENGIAIGAEVAHLLLQIHDGVIPTVAYTPGTGAGSGSRRHLSSRMRCFPGSRTSCRSRLSMPPNSCPVRRPLSQRRMDSRLQRGQSLWWRNRIPSDRRSD